MTLKDESKRCSESKNEESLIDFCVTGRLTALLRECNNAALNPSISELWTKGSAGIKNHKRQIKEDF